MDYKEFKVSGTVIVDKDDVLLFLGLDIDTDADYEPTDDEWLACAREMFENDEILWSESRLEPCK